MAADNELPVFPFRINWREGVEEGISWLTDIMAGESGNEQRRGVRQSPRRSFDVTLTVQDRERSFLDLWLHRMRAEEIMFPLWHDMTPLTAAEAKGSTNLNLDPTGLDFRDGGMALIFGANALNCEAVEIVSVNESSLTIADGLKQAYRRGTRIAPLIRGFMSEEAQPDKVTSRVIEMGARFETNTPNDLDEGVDGGDAYEGLPVLPFTPDALQDTRMDREWDLLKRDNQVGLTWRATLQGRALAAQSLTKLIQGREEKLAFRQWLYRRAGRLTPFWLPTFSDDLTLALPAANGATHLDVDRCGFAYTGGPTSGREHILIDHRQGRIYRKINEVGASPLGRHERLVLDQALPRALEPGDVRSIQFMDTARLDADTIQLRHVNGADGLSVASVPMKTFRNERTAPPLIVNPIPAAAMSGEPCGGDAVPENDPCNTAFGGWYWEFIFRYGWTGGELLQFPAYYIENDDTGERFDTTGSHDGNWTFRFLSPSDWPEGANVHVQLQFPFGYRRGDEEVFALCPTDSFYTRGQLWYRRYDQSDLTLVWTGCAVSISPMGFDFQL